MEILEPKGDILKLVYMDDKRVLEPFVEELKMLFGSNIEIKFARERSI